MKIYSYRDGIKSHLLILYQEAIGLVNNNIPNYS